MRPPHWVYFGVFLMVAGIALAFVPTKLEFFVPQLFGIGGLFGSGIGVLLLGVLGIFRRG